MAGSYSDMANDLEAIKANILNYVSNLDESHVKSWNDTEIRQILQGDILAVAQHNESFTKILEAYSKNLNASSEQKILFKKVFFGLCCGILLLTFLMIVAVIFIVIYMIFRYQHLDFNINGIHTILGVLAGAFLTTFIVLPYVISQYLFNTKEESNMMQIVNLIKEHDLQLRTMIQMMGKNGSIFSKNSNMI